MTYMNMDSSEICMGLYFEMINTFISICEYCIIYNLHHLCNVYCFPYVIEWYDTGLISEFIISKRILNEEQSL